MSEREANIAIRLHKKQGVCLESPATEILYGGAVGGGKSFLMRAAAVMWCGMIPGLQVYLFRRLRDDLVKNHIEGPKGLRMLLAPWVRAGLADMVEDEIRFWNGSKIYLCHCKDEKDRFKYLGAEIHVLLIDELTTFTETIYRFLRSRLRMVGLNVPDELKGRFPRIICGSNPGNVGHQWVKAAFIDPRPPLECQEMEPEEGGMLRQYIPAKLEDNPSMAEDDPNYAGKVSGLGNPQLVKAMRDGDWNVVAGAFFPEVSTDVHVVRPRSLPAYWLKFRSFDWGSARPFSVGWWTVSDGELAEFPRGAIIRYREWYGAQRDSAGRTIPNTGLRMTAEQVADGILERERTDVTGNRTMSGVADPSIFAEDGGPSIADRMAARKVFWRPADNTRVGQRGAMGGWDQVRARLIGDGEKPALYVFDTCLDWIRTFPALQHDEGRPEDIDTDSEDHIADECLVTGTIIHTKRGLIPIERVAVGDMALTRSGYRFVSAVFSNGLKPVFDVRLSNGRALRGTANHPVWVEGIGFIPLAEMRYADILRPWSSSLAPQFRNSSASAIINAVRTTAIGAHCCIGWCGRTSMAAFHAARISTIGTTMWRTITQIISPAWPLLSMNRTTAEFALAKVPSYFPNMPVHPLLYGMDQKRELIGINSITNCIAAPPSRKELKPNACNAARSSLVPLVEQSSAQTPVNPLGAEIPGKIRNRECAPDAERNSLLGALRKHATVRASVAIPGVMNVLSQTVSVAIAAIRFKLKWREPSGVPTVVAAPTIAGSERVYNLSVEGDEEYFANGVLVHNCRYACLSRPYVAPLPAEAREPERDGYRRKWTGRKGARGSAMAA